MQVRHHLLMHPVEMLLPLLAAVAHLRVVLDHAHLPRIRAVHHPLLLEQL